MTFDFDIFRVLVGSCGEKKNMDLVGIVGGNNVCWRGPSERRGEVHKWNQLCSRSDNIQKACVKDRRAGSSQTCWGGSVALRGLAGRTSSYSVNA